jgi:hypothetical protein
MYSSTMKVEVELEYRAIPPDGEFEIIRAAGQRLTTDSKSVSVRLVEGQRLTTDSKSVSVRLVETEKYPLMILEFVMKNQAQYKVVSEISDEVQRWLNQPYNDIAIRFHQPRKKARSR